MKKMIDATDRVKIWNTFFKLAWSEAKLLHETSTGTKSSRECDPLLGGTLAENEFHTLAAMVLANLAIEARANHLIDEMVEQKKITPVVGEAARRLPTQYKWFLLPQLAGTSAKLSETSGPHQAIAQICALRNDLLHVKYADLKKKLPKPGAALSLFTKFVEAMEDMNVVLGRHKQHKKEVLELGKF